jgi:hypothetical protein
MACPVYRSFLARGIGAAQKERVDRDRLHVRHVTLGGGLSVVTAAACGAVLPVCP